MPSPEGLTPGLGAPGELPPPLLAGRVPEVHDDRSIPASTMDAPLTELAFIEYLYDPSMTLVPKVQRSWAGRPPRESRTRVRSPRSAGWSMRARSLTQSLPNDSTEGSRIQDSNESPSI